MFEDGVQMALPAVEALQQVGIGPNFKEANPIISYISSAVSLDISKVTDSLDCNG